MMSYKDLLKEFLLDENNKLYAEPIARRLLRQRFQKGVYRVRGKIEVPEEKFKEKMLEIFNTIVQKSLEDNQFDSSLIPTIISPDKAPNFYIGREVPKEEELYRFLYLLLSGIYHRDFVVNLENADRKVMNKFREKLMNEKILILSAQEKLGINIKNLLIKLDVKVTPPMEEFIFSFAILSYFASWIREQLEREDYIKKIEEMGLEAMIERIGIRDDTALVVFSIPREKKKLYYFPKLKNFFLKWYKNFMEGKEKYPSIVGFIFSLYIADEDYRDLSSSLLNQFLYYFINGYVNGDLLNKLVTMKVQFELQKSKKVIYGFKAARDFFKSL